MIIQMFACDNPKCNNTAPPEEGGTPRKPMTPYGWIHLQGYAQGCGPNYDITVCSTPCASPALLRANEKERDGYS